MAAAMKESRTKEVELDLTGCCFECYLPLAEGVFAGLGKVCVCDPASHTPRVVLGDASELRRLCAALSLDLRVKEDVAVGGAWLLRGAELLLASGQAFELGGDSSFDPPRDCKELEALALQDLKFPMQLTFRSPGSSEAGGSFGLSTTASTLRIPPLDSPEQRIDPSDAQPLTFDALRWKYARTYDRRELASYWHTRCTPLTLSQTSAAVPTVGSCDDVALDTCRLATIRWVRGVVSGEHLLRYVDAIVASFPSEAAVIENCVLDDPLTGRILDPVFFEAAGVRRIGHRRAFEKYFTGVLR